MTKFLVQQHQLHREKLFIFLAKIGYKNVEMP